MEAKDLCCAELVAAAAAASGRWRRCGKAAAGDGGESTVGGRGAEGGTGSRKGGGHTVRVQQLRGRCWDGHLIRLSGRLHTVQTPPFNIPSFKERCHRNFRHAREHNLTTEYIKKRCSLIWIPLPLD